MSLLVFPIIIFISYGIGKYLLGLLIIKTNNIAEDFVFSTGTGLGIIAYIVYALGSFGFLYPGCIGAALIICAFLASRHFFCLIKRFKWSEVAKFWLELGIFEKFLLSVTAAISVICLAGALAPEIGNDALSYHIYHPKIFIQNHRIGYIPYTRESLWPYLTEMLYTIGLLFKSAGMAKMFHYFFGILTAISVYSYTARFFTKKAGLLAAALFYSAPGIFMQSVYAYVDLSLCFYSFSALYLMMAWDEKKDAGLLILSGIFTGFALSVKILGGFAFIALSGLMVFIIAKDRIRPATGLKHLFIFSLSAFLVSCVWYIRSWVILGNPIYPFLPNIFKSGMASTSQYFGVYGYRTGIMGLLMLPWDMVMHINSIGSEQIGVISLAFLPFVFFLPFKKRAIQLTLVFLLIYLASWIYINNVRFVFTYFAILYILISVGFNAAAKRYRFFIAQLLLCGCVLFNLSLCIYHNLDALKLTLNFMSREEYLCKKERTYPIAKFINENIPLNSRLIVAGEPRFYYFDRDLLVYDVWRELSHESAADYIDVLKKRNVPVYLLYRSDAGSDELKRIIADKDPIKKFSSGLELDEPVIYSLYRV